MIQNGKGNLPGADVAVRSQYLNIPFQVFSLKVIAENCSNDCPSFSVVMPSAELLICLGNANLFNMLLLLVDF